MRYGLLLALWAAACGNGGNETSNVADEHAEHAGHDAASMDAVEVAPEHYAVELENEYVRVVRFELEAGEETPTHSHPAGVTVYLSDGSAEITLPNGNVVEDTWEAGDIDWVDGVTHGGTARTGVAGVLVEVKADPAQIAIPDSNATNQDPDAHIVEYENDRVRVVRMTYPPNYETPLHDHLPGVNVMLTDFHGANTPEGGERTETEGEAGRVTWSEGTPPHATANLGDETFEVIKVEIKAAANR